MRICRKCKPRLDLLPFATVLHRRINTLGRIIYTLGGGKWDKFI
jgi:hypothetical protein